MEARRWTIPERRAFSFGDHELVSQALDELEGQLVDLLQIPNENDSITDAERPTVIEEIERRWRSYSYSRQEAIIAALQSPAATDDEFVTLLRAIATTTQDELGALSSALGDHVDLWSTTTLTWCIATLRLGDIGEP